MAAEMIMADEFNEPRSVDDIAAEIRRIPTTLTALTNEIGQRRHAVQTAFSRWDDTTDLAKERETLIDQGLAVAEASAVERANRLIGALREDVAMLKRAAPTSNLTPSEKQDLALSLPVIQEMASHATGATIRAEIEGALLRRDRVALASWVACADRVRGRRGQDISIRQNGQDAVKALPFEERGAIDDAIRKARGLITDLPTRSTIEEAERTIAELEAFARDIRDRANAHDEISDGPLKTYRFGRKPIDGSSATTYSRPKPTENWFRRRAGLQVLVEDRH